MSKADEIEEMIKSTENSINETCKLLQDIPFINKKSADKMFDDEGMWLEYEDQYSMMRKNDDNKVININKITREVDCFGYYTQETDTITLNELKAIYKYCQEQNWIGGEDE